MKVGFIGLGIMGKPMALNVIKGGYDIVVYDVNKAALAEVVAAGAKEAASSKEVAEQCDTIITMLPNSPHVKAAVLGENGVLEGAKPGSIIIDMSSIAPDASKEVSAECAKKGVRMIDAPVSGGTVGAENGTLALMVGGEEADLEEVRPLLDTMAGSIVHCGPIGAGNTTKLVNQMIIAVEMAGIAEAYGMGVKAGLKPQVIYNAIRGGGAGSRIMDLKMEKVIARDFEPGFRLDLHIKDVRNGVETSQKLGAAIPLTELAFGEMCMLSAKGMGTEDHCCMMKYYEMLDEIVFEK